MAVQANFDNQVFDDITGYKITTCLQVKNGVQDSFYVYVEQVIAPQFDFNPVNMDTPAAALGTKRGNLILKDMDGDWDYTFNNIDLVDYQVHFSHFRKVRLLTFRYSTEITNKGGFCTLNNNLPSKDKKEYNNKFAQDYTYSIQGQGEPESLLALSSKFGRNKKEYLRFGTQRSHSNSFMELTMKMDEERSNKNNGIQPKTITYKGLATTINRNNLDAILVDETYGSFLRYSLASLDVISRSTTYSELLEIKYDPLSPYEYLEHSVSPSSPSIIDNAFASSIETAVLILNNGVYLDHSNSMV